MVLSQEVDVKVIGLVYMMLSAKQLKFAQLLRDALIAKVNNCDSVSQLDQCMVLLVAEATNTRPHCNDCFSSQDDIRSSKVMTSCVQSVISCTYCNRKHTLFDFKPEALARQMTLLDAGYFYKLDVRRCDHLWQLTIFFVLTDL